MRVRVDRAAPALEVPDEAREPVRAAGTAPSPAMPCRTAGSIYCPRVTLALRSVTGSAAEASVASASMPATAAIFELIPRFQSSMHASSTRPA